MISWLYHRFIYRRLMRFAHRFDWHYAPEHGPFDDGKYQRWCQWCGMRYSYWKTCPACEHPASEQGVHWINCKTRQGSTE